MSIEIRELVIRAIIEDESKQHSDLNHDALENHNQDALIEACVKQVLKILQRKQER